MLLKYNINFVYCKYCEFEVQNKIKIVCVDQYRERLIVRDKQNFEDIVVERSRGFLSDRWKNMFLIFFLWSWEDEKGSYNFIVREMKIW